MFVGVVIFDGGGLRSVGAGKNARYRRIGADLGARLSRFGQIGDQRIGQRADRTADMTPAVIDASWPALKSRGIDADGAGVSRMPSASKPLFHASPPGKIFIGGMGYGFPGGRQISSALASPETPTSSATLSQ